MSSRRRAVVRTAVVTLLLPFVTTPQTAVQAAEGEPDLAIRITGLSPSNLDDASAVTMAGTVTNRNEHAWTDAQAYLVIPATPFTTRQQVDDAIGTGSAYTGERIVDLKSIDELGDLAPGSTTRFEVRVPFKRLGISKAEGVYPVGVQVLGTDVDGTRDTTAIGRATTFLPLVSDGADAVSAGLVWPFLMPDYRTPDGDYADPEALIALVSTGGRLRHQLDLASAVRSRASTVIVDPALLVGLDDVSRGRRLPDGVEIDERQREAARQFLADLTGLARRDACWVLQYDRADVLGITQSPTARELTGTIERATSATLARFQITGRRVIWPTEAGVTESLLSAVRGTGEAPVIVSATAVPDWEQRDGSLLQYTGAAGPLPLLVNDAIDTGVPGETTSVTLRQRILAEAALASLQGTADPGSRADAIAILDPRWNPGPVAAETPLDAAFDASFVEGLTLEDLMNERLTAYEGAVPRTAEDTPIGAAQLAAAADATRTSKLIGMVTPDGADVEARQAIDIAHALGVRWRENRAEGLEAARATAERAEHDIARVGIDGPDAVTLSSSKGSFPVTISNDTDHPVRVAVRIDSSNPAFDVPDTDSVDVAAGERQTITVAVDMGRQSSATLTAVMITSDGQEFGEPAVFNVRSSRVGVALWVAIGLAAAFVVVALARRFRGHPTREATSSAPLEVGPDD